MAIEDTIFGPVPDIVPGMCIVRKQEPEQWLRLKSEKCILHIHFPAFRPSPASALGVA